MNIYARVSVVIVLVGLIVTPFVYVRYGHSIQKWTAYFFENVSYTYGPSAEKAFRYGEKHFNAMQPSLYDLNRAEHFFRLAAAEDPSIPSLYHELARVEFLKGNFPAAMDNINKQIELHGESLPNSYYVRGLIEGYIERYDEAAEDYEVYLRHDPHNWAAINDYAWVLAKANRFAASLEVTQSGLKVFPENPWLLNSEAIALFELGRYDEALTSARAAGEYVADVTEEQWLTAYPGNDPRTAQVGIATLRTSVQNNIHSIEEKLHERAIQ